MIRAYDEAYPEGAMTRMGDMLEYAVLDLGSDADAFFKMFVDSTYCIPFEAGACFDVAGRSGPELAWDVLEHVDSVPVIEPAWREDRSDVLDRMGLRLLPVAYLSPVRADMEVQFLQYDVEAVPHAA